ncbi:MAG: 16S rRNA (adenine(1518)-N(6)/adenine(1519)-N(6))-dimethyltransferase RsmA [Desulfuromonadales bacterium]
MTSHRPRKRFGQNFLRDQHVLDRIMTAADLQPEDRILEIGPGPGALTERLLSTGLPVLAVEIDRDLGTALQQRTAENLDIRIGDALRLDWSQLLHSPPYTLVANLPYNVSSQILFKILDHRWVFRRLVLMFQKEVGDRLLARENTRDYGILSVLMQTWFRIERVVKVPPHAFFPPPKVDSVVLRFDPLTEPRVLLHDEALYRKLVKSAFAQRRKTLRNSLLGSGWQGKQVELACQSADIDPGRRGETLTIEEFGQLANLLATDSAQGRGQDD